MPKPRQKSTDPVQETLRQHKRDWKDAQKEFVAHLMGLKNGINGRGDNKFGVPPSNIKDPLPGEIGSLLSALTSQFQSLVGGAKSIITEQETYSKTRRKKQEKGKNEGKAANQKKQAPRQSNKTPVDEFLSNVASDDLDSSIEKYGSNKLTRMWQYVKSPFGRNPIHAKRISLLSSAASLYYSFLDLENAVLSLNENSAFEAIAEYQAIHNSLKEFGETLNYSVDSDESAKDTDKPNDVLMGEPTEHSEDDPGEHSKDEAADFIGQAHSDLHLIIGSSIPLKKDAINVLNLITKFRRAEESKNARLASETFARIKKELVELKMILSTMIDREKNDIKREQLKEMLSRASFDSKSIIKLSHNYVSRLLKKYWIELRKSDKTSFHRLQVSKKAMIINKLLQEIMNHLEKTFDHKFISEKFTIIIKEAKDIEGLIRILNLINQSKINKKLISPGKNDSNRRVMDTVMNNEFRRNMRNMIF